MEITRRHTLRKSDFKRLVEQLQESMGTTEVTLFEKGAELITTDEGELYAENKVIVAFKLDDTILPSLRALNENKGYLPSITIDMGAVPYVTDGADVMAPGITKVTPGLGAGTYVVIIDENFGKSLAVGKLLVESDEILKTKKGKVIKNLHYVNDRIWSLQL